MKTSISTKEYAGILGYRKITRHSPRCYFKTEAPQILNSPLDTIFTPACGSNASEREGRRKRRREPASLRARASMGTLEEQVMGGVVCRASRGGPAPPIPMHQMLSSLALSRSQTRENRTLLTDSCAQVN